MSMVFFVRHDEKRQQLFGDIWRDFIPKVFADVPEYYDKGNAIASLGICSWWSDRFVKEIDVADGAKVLDVCSGTHDVARRLLGRRPKLSVFAADRSPEMTKTGQRLAEDAGMVIPATITDAHTLPYADNTFDAVTLQFATRHLRVVETFNEIYRVLKPGGVFYHSDMLRPSSRVIEAPYLLYLRLFIHLTAALFGSTKESRDCIDYFTRAIHHYLKPDDMANLMRDIGFEDVKYRSFLSGVLCRHTAHKPQ